MEDFFKKISFIKPFKSSKKSNPSCPRSSTSLPPLLPPSPSPNDIPVPPPAELPLIPNKGSPHPSFSVTIDSLTTPLPSISPPPPVLTQIAVTQRDYSSRVFEPSPLSKEISPPTTKFEQEKIERRGRHHFRTGRGIPRTLSSRSSSPIGGLESDREEKKKRLRKPFTSLVLPPTTIMTGTEAEKRSKPAKMFREILPVDGAIGAVGVGAPSPTVLANEYSLPNTDGGLVPQLHDQIEPTGTTGEPIYRPDPFGFQSSVPTSDLMALAENGHLAPFYKRVKEILKSEARVLKNRAVHALTTGPRMNNDYGVDMTHIEEPGEPEEDVGTRTAKSVSRSWSKTDLWTSYVLLVLVTTYYSLGSVHSVLVITEAVNDFAMRGEVKYYQFELALSMLDVSRVLGIMIFAKLTNSYSRPLALFIAALVATGGVCIAAFSTNWETFSAGHALFHLGRSGALVVAQVIVSDTSDLSWRGVSSWGLEMGLVIWVWTKPVIEDLIIQKLGWHVPIWIFFSFAFPAAIPSLITMYVFHRRAKRWGFFPALRNVHQYPWWSLKGLWVKIIFFSWDFDPLGVFLWTIGVGLLSTILSVSEKMQAGIGIWTLGLLTGGGLCIVFLALWELWLNKGLRATHKIGRQRVHQNTTRDPRSSLPGERVMITGPSGYDLISTEQAAAELSARVAESHKPGNLKSWRRNCYAYREKCRPLFRTRLLKRRTIPIGCLIGFLTKFSMKIGSWSVWDRPDNLPIEYRKLVESLQREPMLMNIEFTSFVVGGLFVGLLIRMTKVFKLFAIAGLLLMLCGLLIFHYTDISLIRKFQIIISQVIIGFGAGITSISLLVGVQASCKRHSDVGISIGLLMASNALGEMTAEALKRFMQSYLMHLLPPETSQKYFLRALNGHWSVILTVSIAASAFALVMASVGLAGRNLDEVKQFVSGVVFGTDDASRQKAYEYQGCATPSPFIQSPERNLSPRIQPAPASPSTNIREAQAAVEGVATPSLPQDSSGIDLHRVPETPSQVKKPLALTGNSTDHESAAGWETAPSESVVSESRTTSDSRTIMSSAHVPDSYVDGIFTMDSDMEQTPRVIPQNNTNSSKDPRGKSANSPQVGTVVGKGLSTIKQRIFRNRAPKGPHTAGNHIASGGLGFSFKKRQIRTTRATPQSPERSSLEAKSIWSSSITDEDSAESRGIVNYSRSSYKKIGKTDNTSSALYSPVEWENIDRNSDNEHQDFTPQPGSPNHTTIRSKFFNKKNLGMTDMPPNTQAFHPILHSRDEYLQLWQDPMADGGASRCVLFESTLTPINAPQPSVTTVTFEANTPDERSPYSPEQNLSPIKELSSRGSMVDPIDIPSTRKIGIASSSSLKALIALPPQPDQDELRK